MLSTAIRKSNGVGSRSISVAVTGFSSVEVSCGVIVSNSIGVSVRRGLIRVGGFMIGRGSMDNWGVVSGSSVDNRGGVDNGSMVGWGMVDNWSSMDYWGMVGWGGVVDNRGSMVSWGVVDNGGGMVSSMGNWSVSTISRLNLGKTLGVVYLGHRGVGGSESLGLHNASLFSIWSGDRLVGGLTSSISYNWSAWGSRRGCKQSGKADKSLEKEKKGGQRTVKWCKHSCLYPHGVLGWDSMLYWPILQNLQVL